VQTIIKLSYSIDLSDHICYTCNCKNPKNDRYWS